MHRCRTVFEITVAVGTECSSKRHQWKCDNQAWWQDTYLILCGLRQLADLPGLQSDIPFKDDLLLFEHLREEPLLLLLTFLSKKVFNSKWRTTFQLQLVLCCLFKSSHRQTCPGYCHLSQLVIEVGSRVVSVYCVANDFERKLDIISSWCISRYNKRLKCLIELAVGRRLLGNTLAEVRMLDWLE